MKHLDRESGHRSTSQPAPEIRQDQCRTHCEYFARKGLLEFPRGHGITVTPTALKKSVLVTKAQVLRQLARREGYGVTN
jgi:hypothetical protein